MTNPLHPLIYVCAWTIRPDVDFTWLTHEAAEAGCQLVAIPPIRISPQKFAVLTFAVQTPSEESLMTFIQSAGASIGMTEWHSSTVAIFEMGTALYLQLAPDELRQGLIDGLRAYGQYNEQLRKS